MFISYFIIYIYLPIDPYIFTDTYLFVFICFLGDS